MTEFTLPAHVCKLWLVRVTDTAGQVLPPGGFDFYGCAMAPGGRAVAMVAEVRGDATELVLPGLCAPGAWDLSIFCREVATGVTWAVQQGRVNVTPAPGLPCGGVVPAVDELVAVLDPVTQELRVVLGDSTASVAENARLAEAAREGADEAALRVAGDAARVEELKRVTLDVAAGAALDAERAEDSKRGAEAAAGAAAADAQVAEGKAAEAEVSREAAEAAAKQAGARAAEADASAKVAADARDEAAAARGGAVAAQRGAEEAQVVAEDASAQAGRYAEQAVGASDGAVVAQGKAEAAQGVAEEQAAIATAAAEAAQAPESIAAQAARPATMVLVKDELERLLGSSDAFIVDTDGQKIIVSTDRLEDEMLAEVEDMLRRFVPQFIEVYYDPFPLNYTRVEYIENPYLSYLDIAVEYSSEASLKIDFRDNKLEEGGWGRFPYLFGGLTLSNDEPWNFAYTSNVPIRWVWNGSTVYDYTNKINKGQRYILEMNKNGGYLDGVFKSRINYSEWMAQSITLFKLKKTSYSSACEMYSAQITENDKTLLDLVPCLDETGTPCMFDLVSRTPFYNKGQDDFLYPTESTTYSLRRVLPDWGKLTENGLRRLYHVPAGYQGELIDYALENGYKPIIEPEKPETGYWSPRWTETEDGIVLEWVETEPPADDFGLPEEDLTENK